MRRIMVVNPKGGSGKTTIATNLASFYACWGIRVALLDFDPQGSSLGWLKVRPADRPEIHGLAAWRGEKHPPPETDYAIMDLPSGVYGDGLADFIARADTLIVPVLPSPIDIRATGKFFYELFNHPDIADRPIQMGVIANRVRENTRIYQTLASSLESLSIPYLAHLRDTQNYIHAAERGLGIFELRPRQALRDLAQWQPIIRWVSTTEPLSPITPSGPAAEETDAATTGKGP